MIIAIISCLSECNVNITGRGIFRFCVHVIFTRNRHAISRAN